MQIRGGYDEANKKTGHFEAVTNDQASLITSVSICGCVLRLILIIHHDRHTNLAINSFQPKNPELFVRFLQFF